MKSFNAAAKHGAKARKSPSGALTLAETAARGPARGIGGPKVFGFDLLDRHGVKFSCLQNPKIHAATAGKPPFGIAMTWRKCWRANAIRSGPAGVWGANLWSIDSLDRCGVSFTRPRNETFCQDSAEIAPRFHLAAECGAMGLEAPFVRLMAAQEAYKVPLLYTQTTPPNIPQTRRALRELFFTQEMLAHAAFAR